jgi:Protein of unknown function (DUF551)
MTWINIRQEMPGDSSIVLVAVRGIFRDIPLIAIYDSDNSTFHDVEQVRNIYEHVTHWMMIPVVPPEEYIPPDREDPTPMKARKFRR